MQPFPFDGLSLREVLNEEWIENEMIIKLLSHNSAFVNHN